MELFDYAWNEIRLENAQTLIDTIKELYVADDYEYREGNCVFIVKDVYYTINHDYLKATYEVGE